MKNGLTKVALSAAAIILLSTSVFASSGWLTNWTEAKTLSTKENKPILIDFSGSDWCGWCIKLDKEVFSKPTFKEYANKNLILFLADFPQAKKQTKAVKKQNSMLASKYNVRGYPTVVLVDSKGKTILRTGYARGGPENYITNLKKAIDKK
jgi:protein disulfide-isomerase